MVDIKRTTFVDFKAPVLAMTSFSVTAPPSKQRNEGEEEKKGTEAESTGASSSILLVGGGGGVSKTGVLNYLNMYGVGSTTSGLAQLEQRASFQVENMTALVALGMVDSPDCHVFKLNVASKKLDKLGAFKVDFAEEEPGMSAVAFGRRNTIATGGEDGVLRVWKLNTGNDSVAAEAQHEFKGHEKPIADVSFHPNGVIVLTAAARSVRLWSTKLKKCVGTLAGGEGQAKFGKGKASRKWGVWKFCAARFNPAGTCLFALETTTRGPAVLCKYEKPEAGWEQTSTTTKPVIVQSIARDPVVSMTISADGKYIGLGESQGIVMVFRASDLARVHRVANHGLAVTCLSFQPHEKGLTLVSGAADRSIAVCRVNLTPGMGPKMLLLFVAAVCLLVIALWMFMKA